MLDFQRVTLSNGLKVILHKAPSYQMVVTNLFVNAGSKNEIPGKTGVAHFLEHMMFSGTKQFPSYDNEIHSYGGNNNAFTTSDFTNYYHTIPFFFLEKGLELEADRLINLELSEEKFNIQKKVILEEFKETVLNVPYGQKWHFIRPFIYGEHGYAWPTIGASYEEVEQLTIEDCQNYFETHYSPENMVLGIGGNIDIDQTIQWVEKYFGKIKSKSTPISKKSNNSIFSNNLGSTLVIEDDVPLTNTMLLFPAVERLDPDFGLYDIIAEWIAGRKQSPLSQNLVKRREIAHGIGSYISGSTDQGFLSIEMAISPNIDTEFAIEQQERYLQKLVKYGITEDQLTAIKNRLEFENQLQDISLHNRIFSSCYAENLKSFYFFLEEMKHYRNFSVKQINNCLDKLWNELPRTRIIIEKQTI